MMAVEKDDVEEVEKEAAPVKSATPVDEKCADSDDKTIPESKSATPSDSDSDGSFEKIEAED